MMKSISSRLAVMFAACGAIAFLAGGVWLYDSLRSALISQVHSELQLRATLIEAAAEKLTSADTWVDKLVPKLNLLRQEDVGFLVWALSEDESFRYGPDRPEIDSLARTIGFSTVKLRGFDFDQITYVSELPPSGQRPAVRLVLAKDSRLFWHTLSHFRTALIVALLAATAVVSTLGWWIARLGLLPLRRLSRQAQGLNPHLHAQRLDLSHQPSELADLTRSFNGALERLETTYRQLESFNADVAHELRTPLMNLIGQTQVTLTRQRSTLELEETLRSNLEELERLRTIVSDMLFLARADQGALATLGTEVSLNNEVSKVVEFIEPLVHDAGVCVRIAGDARACIETALFQRAITNLLQNAIQHSAAGDEILLSIESDDDGARVAVTNPGGLIEAQHLPHLFNRFYRVDVARRNSTENHGLGLAIVKAVANMHRGAVFVRSEKGHNTFGFTLAARA